MIIINPLQQKLLHASPVLTFKQMNGYLNFWHSLWKTCYFNRER